MSYLAIYLYYDMAVVWQDRINVCYVFHIINAVKAFGEPIAALTMRAAVVFPDNNARYVAQDVLDSLDLVFVLWIGCQAFS